MASYLCCSDRLLDHCMSAGTVNCSIFPDLASAASTALDTVHELQSVHQFEG